MRWLLVGRVVAASGTLLLAALTVGCSTNEPPPKRQRQAQAGAILRPTSSRTLTTVRSAAPPNAPDPPAALGDGWNAGQIAWQPYKRGLALAGAQHKPICLVFFATWCPHCAHFSHVFDNPQVVAEARQFIMIRLDIDRNPALSARYSLDGEYVPRTYFLTPDGQIARTVTAERPRYRYFYNENDPSSLLGGMHRALAALDLQRVQAR